MALQVFLHHVYEYLKGVRQLILHTTLTEHLCEMEARLRRPALQHVDDVALDREVDLQALHLEQRRIGGYAAPAARQRLAAGLRVDEQARIGMARIAHHLPRFPFLDDLAMAHDDDA